MELAAHTNPSLLSIRQQGRSPECVGGEHTSPCTQTDDVNERELVSEKNEHGGLERKVKTHVLLKMAPQAKPLCSRDVYRNSV